MRGEAAGELHGAQFVGAATGGTSGHGSLERGRAPIIEAAPLRRACARAMAANSSAIVRGGCQPNAARKALASTTSEPASRSNVRRLADACARHPKEPTAAPARASQCTPSAAAIARASSGVDDRHAHRRRNRCATVRGAGAGRPSSASSALAKLPAPSRLRRLSMPASGNGTPRAIASVRRATLAFAPRSVHQRQPQHGDGHGRFRARRRPARIRPPIC